jgi:hypothetical protein
MHLIWDKREAESFCKRDWTGQITLIRLNKSPVSRSGLRRRGACHRAALCAEPLAGNDDLTSGVLADRKRVSRIADPSEPNVGFETWSVAAGDQRRRAPGSEHDPKPWSALRDHLAG